MAREAALLVAVSPGQSSPIYPLKGRNETGQGGAGLAAL